MAKAHIKTVFEHDNIIRSENDNRQYRGLELNNGMKILLVSDQETDKSAAAMDVNIGHMKDPRDIPGIAHFCEHMLFLGTEKYPEENAYTKFLNEHGGGSNAFTSLEHTNFYFDVAPESLSGALDRFAQFFLCPLFTPSATEREVNAVNSENDRNLQSDPWRIFQLEKSLCNKDTLLTQPAAAGVDVREQLLSFHSQFYSSNIMALAVVGKESLDQLTEMVVPLFCGVENKSVTVPEWLDAPYGPEQSKMMVSAVPVKDVRDLAVSWGIPDLHPYYKANPGHYLGHLIGHEGPGSLLSELKARGWVNTLVGGQKSGAKGFSFFMINVDLTEEGQEHVDDIITLIYDSMCVVVKFDQRVNTVPVQYQCFYFIACWMTSSQLIYQYINCCAKKDHRNGCFDECRDLSAMQFRFKDKEKPRKLLLQLSKHASEVLSAPYLFNEFNPDLINMILEKLTPDNMRVMVVSKKFEGQTDKTEQWYGTQYRVDTIEPALIEAWNKCGLHDNLRLPDRNEFIPSDFDLVPREAEDTAMTRVWFRQDDKFLKPKACISYDFISPYAYIDPLHANLSYMFVGLFKDALNEYSYAAEIAGLHYNLDCSPYGVYLEVKGYNHKLDILLKKIMERLTTFVVDPQRFDIIKEAYERGLRNFRAEQPHQHAVYYTSVLMSEVVWTKDELLQALEDVTVERLQAFIPQLLSLLYIEALLYGNITKQKALDTTAMIEKILRETCKTKPLVPSLNRRHRCYYLYQQQNEVHNSSCIEIYYQCGLQKTETNMLLELFCQIIGDQCFDTLRTKEQLGYIVFSGVRRSKGVQGLRVIVQSDRPPMYVEGRVEAFLQKMEEELKKLSEEDFQKHVSALATKRLELPKRLAVQNAKFWSEIISQQYNFDRDNVEVAFLRKITKDDLYQFYKDMIAHDAPRRHKLSVHIVSQAGDQEVPGGTADTVAANGDSPDGPATCTTSAT
ncbi:hypothetical protein BaRGS_00022895, partial [Batillaria attramentaria]